MWRQITVRQGNTQTTCWVEYRKELKVGKLVELKGQPGLWKVLTISDIALDQPPRSDWKVGGLT